MGFTRNKIRDEANKTFGAFEIDDAPNGKLSLLSQLRVSEEAQANVKAYAAQLQELEKDADADISQIKDILTALLAEVADRPDDLREYVKDFDSAELLTLFTMWGKETAAGEAKPLPR